ncbi:uncharacterized protein N0V89_002663 [Didymosphaeria variabile]|uniref:Fibronectin type-III domain-containing protein n=1 Tax=Didymosphaeria variabile TaxID=1932322 RepID=A0A9W8XT34_9PLEO|nr:uncharacterized protein N0V89_002663 [Didymosphaeria variabile]KAJ4358084.1 hypothetical protein N0V89_002663 [Didymosphaeria variabile]
MFPDTAHSLYWPPDVARYNMEALVFLSSGWLKTACVLLALFWVAFRAYRVLSKPVEELINLLGLEVPVAPLVSLAGIKADGVLLHWKPPDQRSSVVKYVIRINGIDIGDVSPQETSVTIENLQPDHHYVIRIVTLNTANFQAPSVPIRLRTLPTESEQFYGTGPHKEIRDGAQGDDYNPTPIIRPNKNLVDFIVPSITAPAMTREHSNSVSRHRRSEPGRRNSPASGTAEQARAAQEAVDSQETIKQLTEKLDSLRRELEDMEKQIQDEEQEFVTQKALLVEKRDEKRASLKEKEDASRDLRKEVAILERANASAQAKRSNQERLLQKKEAERKKLKDDMAKWEREAGELRTAAQGIQKERTEYEALSENRIKELKGKHEEELQTNKSLEDVIREKGIQIKTLEEERKLLEDGEDVGDAQDGVETEAEDRRWMELYSSLQQRYAEAWQQFNEAEHINKEASARLAYLQQRRMSQPQVMSVTAPEFVPARRNSGVRSRPLSMREPLTSANLGGFIPSTAAPFNSGIASTSPSYTNPTPYFNPVNGMALPPPSAHASSFSQADIESLTGGAPMSPTAGALLPSGLFGDGTTDDGLTDEDDPGPPLPSLDPSPNLRHILPGLGAPGTLEQVQSPSSPVSVQSRSPFASPRESVGQLGFYPSNENALDSDRRSIRSTSSSFKNPPTTRFGSLFGLHRQRGKTFDQGPPLGSLKSSQSQSLPRQDHEDLDPIGTRRRRGSHSGGAWYNAFIPGKAQPEESSSSPKHVATRKRAFNMFGTKGDPWSTSTLGSDRPSSPRQGSTKSGEANVLPRPSTESQTRFGWNVDAFNARSSPLGVDWSINNTNSSSWSRMPSRRPSIQHGSTVSLLNDGLLHDDIPDFPSTTRSPTQAPIGTRPQSSASHMAPFVPPTPPKMLNPDAPTFTFGFGDKDVKAKKAAEKAEKAADKEAKRAEKKAAKVDKSSRKQSTIPEVAVSEQSSSPIAARFSRDNYSLSTADYSETSPRESLDQSGSQTTSELQPPASFGKESFMQKLSRKSSSSQFLQFGKGQRSLFSKKSSEAVTPDETDEDGGGLSVRTTDSPGASPSIGTPKDKSSALSWSSIKRIGKRGDKTPSLHESVASETTGDEDEEAAEGLGVVTQ